MKQALGTAGSAEVLFFQGLFALLALLIYAAISRQFGCLLPRCWRLLVTVAGLAVLLLLLFIDALNFMTLTGVLMPGETISHYQWLSVIISFINVGLGADEKHGALGHGAVGTGGGDHHHPA